MVPRPVEPKPKPKAAPMLSIIITAYNTADYIEKCISSLVTQKWGGAVEILVCDDNSDDGTFWKIPTKVGNVYTIKNDENLGISKSANRLFKMARGEYLFFMGSDDYLTGNYFEYAFGKLQKGYEAVYTDMQIENEKGKKFGVGTLYLPIFHRKHLVKWEWPKDEAGHDIPQKKALEGVKSCCNPSADYHYVRRSKNHTAIYGKYVPKENEVVPPNEHWKNKMEYK